MQGSRLRLGARIGRGGMAEVFAGRMVGVAGFEKDVAVKRVLPRYAGDPQFLSRFLAEARLAARLSHPNIVQIFELGQDGRDHYIVMEAVRGVNLRACMDALDEHGEKMPIEVALHIAHCLCAGLAHAHEMTGADGKPLGIVHRDVSPHNILLGFAGAVKLIDFGIARAVDVPSHTQTGRVLGKPHFMSPEQVRGEDIDGRADCFAVGVVLFEMLSGKRPVDGDVVDVVDLIAEGKRLHLQDVEPDLDPEVIVLVEKALAYDIDQRYASARDFANAIGNVQKRFTGGVSQVETLLARLFPAEAVEPWPVENSKRADEKERTQTVAPAPSAQLKEITLVSDSGPATRVLDPGDITLSDRPVPRRRGFAPIAAGFITGVALVAAAVVVLWKPFAPEAAPVVDAGAVVATIARVDAGAQVPLVPVFVDAGDARSDDAGDANAGFDFDDAGVFAPAHHKTKPAAQKTGKLNIDARPWANVSVGGKSYGATPVAITLPAGVHVVKLVYSGVTKSVDAKVDDGKETQLRVDMRH